MPFAGAQLAHSQGSLVLLAVLASLASNIGSIPAYWVGAKGGRPAVERFGRFVLLGERDLDRAEHFFAKYGSITVLVGRMLPIIRTFIALPAVDLRSYVRPRHRRASRSSKHCLLRPWIISLPEKLNAPHLITC